MEPVTPLPSRLRVLRDEPFRSYALVLFAVSSALLIEAHAATYYWDANGETAGTGGTGNWNTTSALWRKDSTAGPLQLWLEDGTDITANLTGSGGTLTVTEPIGVHNILAGSTYTITGTSGSLTLLGSSVPTLDVTENRTLTITSKLSSHAGFTKSGAGTLVIDNPSNDITGSVLVTGGILQIGSAARDSAPLALRGSSIDLALGTSLTSLGTAYPIRLGNLTGTGTVNVNRTLHLQSLGPANPLSPGTAVTHFNPGAVFSGKITAGGLTLSGMGSNTVQLPGGISASMQTLNGDSLGITGRLTINSGAALTLTGRLNPLSGTSQSATGSINPSGLYLYGGTLVFDNSTGSVGSGRIKNNQGGQTTPDISSSSGSLILVGSSAKATQTVGATTFHSGANTIAVIHKGASDETHLHLTSWSKAASSRSTIDFRAEGGTLGAVGGNPRITLGNSATSLLDPWITVNGSDYAQYINSTYGVSAATYESPTGAGDAAKYYQITDNFEHSGTADFAAKGISLKPAQAGQSLNLTAVANIQTTGLLLAGNHDYTISSTGGGGLTSTAPRYIGVAEPGTTLTISAKLMSPGQDIVKFGQGLLDLTGDNTGTLNSSTNYTSFVLNQGTLRATLGSSNASLPTNGTTSVAFRGGVLEIANGRGSDTATAADFQFALGTGAGMVNWATNDNDRGDGGFSAFGSDATVNIGGAATPSTLTWNEGGFVRTGNALTFGSTKADRRITMLNPIDLDGASEAGVYNAREIRVLKNPTPGITTDAVRFSGTISGEATSDLMKTGPGTLQLTGNNTFTGNTIVQSGTLQLGSEDSTKAGGANALGGTGKILVNSKLTPDSNGTSLVATDRGTLLLAGDPQVTDRINDNAELVLDGGIFNTNGRSETLGALTLLHTESILDLGLTPDGLLQSVLRFADSSSSVWTGGLQIWNYTPGKDLLYFGNDASGLRADQLPQLRFYSDNGLTPLGSTMILDGGETLPVVPEPSTMVNAGLLVGILVWRERRRLGRLLESH